MYWFLFTLITFLIIFLAGATIFWFRYVWQESYPKTRAIAQNALLSLFSLLLGLMIIELSFKLFFAQSDGFGYTLANTNWFERYWKLNSLGYRDIEWTPDLLEHRTKIMVLGDSFVAGHGIKNQQDRFSDVLGQMLGEDYAVMNVGKNGASTQDEIRNALNYPYQPDIVILTYYINDIDDTARALGFERPQLRSEPWPALKPLVEQSYALNFFYWRIVRLGPQEWQERSWDWLLNAYTDPAVWQAYRQELLQIHDYIEARDGQLIVVVFPNLLAPEQSRPITSPIVELYAERKVPVLDVTDIIKGIDPQDLVVSGVDSHPNEFLHRLLAEHLFKLMSNPLPASNR